MVSSFEGESLLHTFGLQLQFCINHDVTTADIFKMWKTLYKLLNRVKIECDRQWVFPS